VKTPLVIFTNNIVWGLIASAHTDLGL